ACAAVGQPHLMDAWRDALAPHQVRVAQVLLTADDLANRKRFLNARRTFARLLEAEVAPIVNENDTVAVDEIKVGDNDTLAALVTSLIDADALLLLSDVNGLYDRNPAIYPDAALVEMVERVTKEVREMAGGAGTVGGTGG